MCVVSMGTDHNFQKYPNFQHFPPSQYTDYMELLRKARLYDELMKQKDCPDPIKAEWQKQLEIFMLEKYNLKPIKE